MRRKYQEIIGYDYTSMEEYERHRKMMESKGWRLVEGFFQGALDPSEIYGRDKYVYSANYIKSPYM